MQPDETFGYQHLGLKIGGNTGDEQDRLRFGYVGDDFQLSNADGTGSHSIHNLAKSGRTYLLALQMEFRPGPDEITLYVNPSPGLLIPSAAYVAGTKSDLDLGAFTQISLIAGFGTNASVIDEIRISDTFADVAPYAYYRERFDSEFSFTGDDGALSWSNPWQEVSDDGLADAGPVQIRDNISGNGGAPEIWIQSNSGLWREADTSGATSTILNFDYAREDLAFDDHLIVYAQSGGGMGGIRVGDAPGTWDEIGRFGGAADDAAYLSGSIDISDYIAGDTRIMFYASAATDANDGIRIDNVSIDLGSGASNLAPTMTAFAGPVETTTEDTECVRSLPGDPGGHRGPDGPGARERHYARARDQRQGAGTDPQ